MAKILVVDDLAYNVEFLEGELSARGYEVVAASNGHEALEQVARAGPDLVLLDLSLPGMDGIEVLKALREHPDHKGLPVILLTARTDLDQRVKGLDAGADDYVGKPFQIEEIAARIRAQLRIQALQRETLNHQRLLARVQAIGQLLVTLSHHINNATQSISGMAQLCAATPDSLPQHRMLAEIALNQTARITAVLQSLQQMVDRMDVRTADYAGDPDRMLDIEEELRRRLGEHSPSQK